MNRFKFQNSVIWAVLLLCAFVLMVIGTSENVNHDEAQFIASAHLIQAKGLLPIIDYVYYHQPLFSFFYAGLIGIFGSPIMMNLRIFSALCVIASLIVLIRTYIKYEGANSQFNRWERLFFPIAVLFVFAFNILIRHGLISWNHAFPTFLLLCAFLLVLRDHTKFNPKLLGIAGLLFALAVGMRASLAPMVVPIFGAIFFYKLAWKPRIRLAFWFFVGCLVGSIPVFIYMIKDFDAFYFNLLQFHTKFDTNYLAAAGRARSFGQRLGLAYGYMVNSSAFYLSISFILTLIGFVISSIKNKRLPSYRVLFATAAFLMAIISALTKNVTFIQYYYLPALMLAMLIGELFHFTDFKYRRFILPVIAVLGIVHVVKSDHLYHKVYDFTLGEKVPVPMRVYNEGQFIHEKAGDGYVLTLAPEYVLEGDCDIYPEFVTSPFAFRTRDFVPEEYRERYHVIGPKDLETYMVGKSPCAVYTGWEGGLDGPLDNWAEAQGYTKIETPFTKKLWIRN